MRAKELEGVNTDGIPSDVEERSSKTSTERQDATNRAKGNRIEMGIQNQEERRYQSHSVAEGYD